MNDGSLKVKFKLLCILKILTRYTDAQHPVSAQELCGLLEQEGIRAERKSVYRDIAVLRDSGYEIVKTRVPKPGIYLGERDFSLAEVRLLADAVAAAPFLTQRKTQELTQKLQGLLSSYEAEEIGRQVFAGRVKFDNEEVCRNINILHSAISRKRKIIFRYHHRVIVGNRAELDQGRVFKISPYALLWDHDRYYLAGNYEKYPTVSNYRLDRMKQLVVTPEEARPFSQVSEYQDRFDAADYQRKSFHMFSGQPEQAEFCCSTEMLDAILDKFGNDVEFLYQDSDQFTIRANVLVSDGLVEWVLQYGGRVRVLRPESLIKKTAEKVKALSACFKDL